jgi:hypothetical protein
LIRVQPGNHKSNLNRKKKYYEELLTCKRGLTPKSKRCSYYFRAKKKKQYPKTE